MTGSLRLAHVSVDRAGFRMAVAGDDPAGDPQERLAMVLTV
jgi:hypothetical protein